jgi:D-alanine-D-alanine ligase
MPDRAPLPVLVLYNQTEQLLKGEPGDLVADQGVIACAQAVEAALTEGGIGVTPLPFGGDVEQALRPFSPTQWLVFNLAEGLDGKLFEEVRIAWALEVMGYRFTGGDAPALALTTHKARAKACLRRAGVPTPDWRLFSDPEQVTRDALGGLGFPLIVKPVAEDASLGIRDGAVVRTLQALRQRVALLVERYRQAALVEAFVDGREFNIAIWGDPPKLLPLAEINFDARMQPDERIVSFAAKWEPESFAYSGTPATCPAQVDGALAERIRLVALDAWRTLQCNGYGRVDLRVDAQGTPLVLEVNCNPDISPDAGFFRSAKAGGYDYRQMVEHMVEMATKRVRLYD